MFTLVFRSGQLSVKDLYSLDEALRQVLAL